MPSNTDDWMSMGEIDLCVWVLIASSAVGALGALFQIGVYCAVPSARATPHHSAILHVAICDLGVSFAYFLHGAPPPAAARSPGCVVQALALNTSSLASAAWTT